MLSHHHLEENCGSTNVGWPRQPDMVSSSMSLHPGLPSDVPLILKASCDERLKRIRFPPNVQLLCFSEFQRKVAHALQFDDVEFSVTWQDDDGERCEITSNEDLSEALAYFAPSLGSQSGNEVTPITMRVNVRVETAVSLSDFGSSVLDDSDGSDESVSVWRQGSPKSMGSQRAGVGRSLADRSYSRPTRLSSASSSANGAGPRSKRSGSNGTGKVLTQYPWHVSRVQSTTFISRSPTSSASASLNGGGEGDDFLRTLSLHSSSLSTDSVRDADVDSDSDDSVHTRAPRAGAAKRHNGVRLGASAREAPNGFNVHEGVRCRACNVEPIVGVRYHCASCVKGADFCEECERNGMAIRKSTQHTESHLMLKLATPIRGDDVAEVISHVMGLTTKRLIEQASTPSSSSVSPSVQTSNTSSSAEHSMTSTNTSQSINVAAAVRCSFCSTPILGVRYMCANCPINSASSHDGYNLCHSCEAHSLKCHDPAHFFIKISAVPPLAGVERLPLGERWYVLDVTQGGPLLPCLYADQEPYDPFLPPSVRSTIGNQTVRIGDSFSMDLEAVQEQHAILAGSQGDQAVRLSNRDGTAVVESQRHQSAPTVTSSGFGLSRWRSSWCPSPSENRGSMELRNVRQTTARSVVPLSDLCHPSILCDSCFQVIHGAWYRCCHCTSSYDLCGTCMSRIAHDSTHAFAVFKQPVDLDLFKSCVDHQDAGDTPGSSRPMLAFPLS